MKTKLDENSKLFSQLHYKYSELREKGKYSTEEAELAGKDVNTMKKPLLKYIIFSTSMQNMKKLQVR